MSEWIHTCLGGNLTHTSETYLEHTDRSGAWIELRCLGLWYSI